VPLASYTITRVGIERVAMHLRTPVESMDASGQTLGAELFARRITVVCLAPERIEQ
jgi:hypothetical protein